MSFSAPQNRAKENKYTFELNRFASLINSKVDFAASRLLSFFMKNIEFDSIVSFLDCNYSSLSIEENVYSKLGFEFDGKVVPNYRYWNPKLNILENKQNYQLKYLSSKLENFNKNLSERENMENNGFKRVYDCGKYRFVLRRIK